ncbi:unnamed protein product, partial [Polarella glacialis]
MPFHAMPMGSAPGGGVVHISHTFGAFAAILVDGSVVTWGDSQSGADSSAVAALLTEGVVQVVATDGAFAAMKANGSVVTWGSGGRGGDSSAVAALLTEGVVQVCGNCGTFVARLSNGSIVTWGDSWGRAVQAVPEVTDAIHICSTSIHAWCAFLLNGSVVTWGSSHFGGDSSAVAQHLTEGVVQVCGTNTACAALMIDGSVVTWGDDAAGGDSSGVALLLRDIISVTGSGGAFAAIRQNGCVLTWGDDAEGGDSSEVAALLTEGVVHICGIEQAFAAIKDIVAHAPTNSTRASRREFIRFIARMAFWNDFGALGHRSRNRICLLVLIFGCAFFWSLTGGNERCDSSFNGSFWASYTYLVDIGTQTGLRPDESYEVRFVAVVISLLGFVYSLTLLGMVVDGIRDILNIMKQHYSMIHVNNHCLILGWGEKTLFLIHELLAEQKNSVLPPRSCLRCGRRQKRTIVILSELSEYAMSEKVMNHFRFWAVDVSHVNIRYATGNPTNRTDLRKVSASLADDILVMCLGQGGKVSDQEAIQTLLALGALPGGVSGDVWVEMHDKNVSSVVSTLLPAADGIIARHSVTRMALLRSLVPSVGFAYMELASFRRGSQICVVDAPKELIGCRFIDACYQFQNAILLGVTDANNRMLKEDSASPGFMPGADYLLKEGNQLVMISSNIMSASKLRRATDKPPLQKRSPLERTYKAPRLLRDDGQLWLGPAAEKKMIVLMIGCPDDFPEMLKIIDLFLASGSEVHILSDQTLAWRESCLNQHGNPPFERLLVRHYVGSTTNKSELSRLPLGTASCALILAERLSDDEEPISSDSRSLTT